MKKSLRRWAILALVLVLFLSTVMSVRAGTSLDTGGATVTVDSYGAFYTAFSNAENGDVIGIEGTITIPAVVTLDAGYDEITIRRMAIDAKIVISGTYGEDSKATFKNISFDGNATWVGGSEPFIEVSSNAYFDNCSFYDCLNQSGNGGAMYLSSGAAATVNNCEFESNSAINGSHIYNEGTLTVSTTSFTDGWADAYGGAIYNTGTLSLVDSTITENHTRIGGGLYNIGSVDITNSLIWNNEGTIQGADIANDGSMNNSTTEEQYNQYLKEYGLYYAGWEEDTNTSVGGTGDYIKMLTTDKEPTEPEETEPEETEPEETEPTEPAETEPESPTEPTETEPSAGTEDEGNTGGNNTEDSGSSGDTDSEEPNTEGNNEGESGDNEGQEATEAPSGSTEGGETEAPSTSTPSDTDSTEESGGSVSIDNSTTDNSSTDNSTVDNSSSSSTVDNSSVVSDTDNSSYESNDNSSYREDNSYRDSSTTSTVNNYYQSSTDTTPQSNTSSQGGSQPITVNVTVPETEKADTGSQATTAATSETDANQNIHIEAEGVDLEYEYIDGVVNLSIKAHTEAESPTEAANVMEAVSTSTTLSEQAETAESGSNWVQIISMILLAALVVLEVKDKIKPHKEA